MKCLLTSDNKIQVTTEAVKILKVVEKCSKADGDREVNFDFQEHLLGGVSSFFLRFARVWLSFWVSLQVVLGESAGSEPWMKLSNGLFGMPFIEVIRHALHLGRVCSLCFAQCTKR